MVNLPKVIFIVGATASGKTNLSTVLAKEFNGEIVNADSRQVYKEMSVATAKPARDVKSKNKKFVFDDVVHHLMDIIRPNQPFSLSDYKKRAIEAIDDILSRNKLPIVVGGTGLYVWSLVDNLDIPKVAPNKKLRNSFENKSLVDLVKLLRNVDPKTAEKIDLKNKRRVLRALEVVISSGESFVKQSTKSFPIYDCLQIGINLPREDLYQRINHRVDLQLESGLIEETKRLSAKYSWDLPSMSSIGYKQIGSFLRNELSLDEALELFKRDTRRYAKKQISWFKRDKRIIWVKKDDWRLIKKIIGKFLNK